MMKYDRPAKHLLLCGIVASFLVMAGSESSTEYADSRHCPDGYRYSIHSSHNTHCIPCPDLHESCISENCCREPSIMVCNTKLNISTCQCRNGDTECSIDPSSSHSNVMVAAQIALIIALVISATAFAVLIFKTCRRRTALLRRNIRRRQERASLSSIQRFVVERLQNRPPRYEDTRHLDMEKPPSYQEALQASGNENLNDIWSVSGSASLYDGIDNPVYRVSELPSESTLRENDGQRDYENLTLSGSRPLRYLDPMLLATTHEPVSKDLPASPDEAFAIALTTSGIEDNSTKSNGNSIEHASEGSNQRFKDNSEAKPDFDVFYDIPLNDDEVTPSSEASPPQTNCITFNDGFSSQANNESTSL